MFHGQRRCPIDSTKRTPATKKLQRVSAVSPQSPVDPLLCLNCQDKMIRQNDLVPAKICGCETYFQAAYCGRHAISSNSCRNCGCSLAQTDDEGVISEKTDPPDFVEQLADENDVPFFGRSKKKRRRRLKDGLRARATTRPQERRAREDRRCG